MTVVEFTNVTKSYRTHTVLNEMNFTIKRGVLTGIIGRNGVGKTTLMKLIVGFIEETSGKVEVFSEKPFNSLKVSANSILVDDGMNFPYPMTVTDILKECSRFYSNWDAGLAERLISYFGFHRNARHAQLSKGKKSTFNAIVGISARCALTIFDEPTTGMDSSVPKDFYRALLKDYLAHPRTILLSSHHIEEIEDLLEDVLLVHEGIAHFHGPITELQEMFITLTGKREKLALHTKGKSVYGTNNVGPYPEWTIQNTCTQNELEQMKLDGIAIAPVTANDAYIALTNQPKGGIDDVFE
jgi:ABC-2 type transport system ATP-binding protein